MGVCILIAGCGGESDTLPEQRDTAVVPSAAPQELSATPTATAPSESEADSAPAASSELPAPPLDLEVAARIAFRQGLERDGYQFLYAQMLMGDSSAGELLDRMKWSSLLKRPTLGIRWGVGVKILMLGDSSPPHNDVGWTGITHMILQSPKAIVSNNYSDLSEAVASLKRTSVEKGVAIDRVAIQGIIGGSYGTLFCDRIGRPGVIVYGVDGNTNASEIAQRLGLDVTSLVCQGTLRGGVICSAATFNRDGSLKCVFLSGTFVYPGNAGYTVTNAKQHLGGSPSIFIIGKIGSQEGVFTATGRPWSGAGSGNWHSLLAQCAGDLRARLQNEFQSRMSNGVFGHSTDSPRPIFIGVRSELECLEEAQREGIDILGMIKIEVTEDPQTKLLEIMTYLNLYKTESGSEIFATKPIRINTRAAIEASSVNDEIDSLLRFVDSNLTFAEWPQDIDSEAVRQRLSGMGSSANDSVLSDLAGISVYRHKGFLENEDVLEAYRKLLGGEKAEKLVHGSPEDKRQLVEALCPDNATVRDLARVEQAIAEGDARKEQKRLAEELGLPVCGTNSIGMNLSLIPPGEFVMGGDEPAETVAQRVRDYKSHWDFSPKMYQAEHPQHRVKITKPFYLGVYEVTKEQYEEVMGENPSRHRAMPKHLFPVDSVSWDMANMFCVKLSASPNESESRRRYRLPTEAKWEYACRAGTTTATAFGDFLPATLAHFDWIKPYDDSRILERPTRVGLYVEFANGCWKPRGPTQVGLYVPNGFGLYDMHGNLLEWCQDLLDPDYYKVSGSIDPEGPPSMPSDQQVRRVSRGGSYVSGGAECRSAFRAGRTPSDGIPMYGFRVVCEVEKRMSMPSAMPRATESMDDAGRDKAEETNTEFTRDVPARKTELRKFADITGKFTIEAEVQEVRERTVLLKRADGQVVEVPIARLTEADRDYVAAMRDAMNTEGTSDSEIDRNEEPDTEFIGEARAPKTTQFRKFTDITGEFTIEAEVQEIREQSVLLKKPDGQVVEMPVARLSEADRDYLASMRDTTKAGERGERIPPPGGQDKAQE